MPPLSLPLNTRVIPQSSPAVSSYALPRYWFCVIVHTLVVVMRAAMVVVWALHIDHKWTFDIKHLSAFTAILNFVTSVTIMLVLATTLWSLQSVAMHHAFTKPQSLTGLHDRTSAWLGPGAAAATVLRNGINSRVPGPLVILLLYFASGWGVSSTFGSSFTFGGFNDTVYTTAPLNALTTATTKTANPSNLTDTQAGAAFLTVSFDYFPSLYNIRLPGLGFGMIYDTLSSPEAFAARIRVPALGFNVQCGEVDPSEYNVDIALVDQGINITASATLGKRTVGVTGTLPLDVARSQQNAFFKVLEESDPASAPPSRNLYILQFSTKPEFALQDSRGSSGTLITKSVGQGITGYTKVISCALTTFNTSATIDGLNHAVNNSDEIKFPPAHNWQTQAPLTSRNMPYEDTFSALYQSVTAIRLETGSSAVTGQMQFSIFETELIKATAEIKSLWILEVGLMKVTSISFAAMAERYGFSNILPEVKEAGWDPRPTLATVATPVLRARLNMSQPFVLVGLGASILFFIAALLILDVPPRAGETLVGDPGLLSILAMLRRSTLPERISQGLDDTSALDSRELRRFGSTVVVQLSGANHLDVIGAPPSPAPRDYKHEENIPWVGGMPEPPLNYR